ncbi:UDP-N-acetylmuramate dehydrogenase [Mucilaginibacter sp. cycad4]|uniref:UDP-N-acetylmuramate dehydrogenase n=1 Tax=Mucilaginibacter sp. cycad4 TaxID=3342096 RepID=UPI002AAA63B7|nr:UDP-N-acetylmuramate dehydrogenase [Mucilaginibacter gossypii]WPV00222.1 UDP-N-acetylmuramate dehydrogenase [Mucilaginibacter gossypii]
MRVFENFDLTGFNSYRIKATCRKAYFPESTEDIIELFKDKDPNRILIGAGYNILLSKDHYDADFVLFSGNYEHMELVGNDSIICEAGCDMKKLSEFALQHNLAGLEIFYDIPSSLGGAVVMNAGASGEDIKGLLVKVWYYNPNTNTVEEISKEDIGFEYRNSFFQKNPGMIICKALLKLTPGDPEAIKQKMDTLRDARWSKQPRDYPNAGSVFKRPPGYYVGAIMDELKLKGFAHGGARVSEKHGGFIINFDNAKGGDIIEIIAEVKRRVMEKYNLDLEVEQRII